MAKLAVFSDTHGNFSLFKRAIASARKFKPDYIVHLGDDYADIDEITPRGEFFMRVPGLWCAQYKNPFIENQIIFSVQGYDIAMLHDLRTFIKRATSPQIILYGHTHFYDATFEDNRLLFNPGHLKGDMDRGVQATFGILELEDSCVEASIFSADGVLVFRKSFALQAKAVCE